MKFFRKMSLLLLAVLAFVFICATPAQTDTPATTTDTPDYVATFRFPKYVDGLDWPVLYFPDGTYDYYNLDGLPNGQQYTNPQPPEQESKPLPVQEMAIDLRTATIYYHNTDNTKLVGDWMLATNDMSKDLLIKLAVNSDSTAPIKNSPVTLNFVDDQNHKTLDTVTNNLRSQLYNEAPDPLENLHDALYSTGADGQLLTTRSFDGYSLDTTTPLTNDGNTYTYHYVKDKSTSDNNPSTPIATTIPAESSSSDSTTESGTEPATGTPVAVKGEAVYATKKIGLYRHATFTKASRLHWYAKQVRTKRPQFVVTGYAHSKNGLLRYQIRDVNHTAKTDGQRGYITADEAYVTPTYYQKRPAMVQVISNHGINVYRHIDLSGRAVRHYHRGSVLKIKDIQRHNLTTRLVLANGDYLTGNKTLVIKK